MARLPLMIGMFLAVTVSGVVLLLSILAKVTWATVVFRFLTVFFLFGLLGVGLGMVLEVFLMPGTTEREVDRLKEEMALEDTAIEKELGDLLPSKRMESTLPREGATEPSGDMKPAVFPHMTKENGRLVSRGESTVVS